MNSDLEEFSVGVHGLLSRQLSQALGSEEDFDALERDIGESMANVFRSFRRAKNDESLINALPAELLALILQHVEGSALDTLLLTHVCEHWRAVALDDHSLWTRIVLHGRRCTPEILGELLARTGSLGIELELSGIAGDASALGRVVSDHLPRLEALAITGDSRWLGTLQSALVLPAPVLRALELCDIDANTVAIIQTDILARQTPCLEKLALTNVVPTIWNNFLFAHLRELSLAGNCLSPSTFDLATCLASIPALRQLSLSCRIRPFPSHSGDELPWVAPELRVLEIAAQEDDAVVSTVLDHLPVCTLDVADVSPAALSTMVQLLKSLPGPMTALALTAPSALAALTVRATGSTDGSARGGVVHSTDGVPCALLLQHLDAPLTASLARLALAYELWPHALALSLPALAHLVVHYSAVPPPAYQLSLFLNPVQGALHLPALRALALAAPARSPIKLATLSYLLTRAITFDAPLLDELVLVNVYAEEEPGSESLVALCASAKRLAFLPALPARFQV